MVAHGTLNSCNGLEFTCNTTSTALEGYLFSSFGRVLDFISRGPCFKSHLGWIKPRIVYFYISTLSLYNWNNNKNYDQKRYKTVLTPLSVTQGTYLCGGLRASVCCAIWCSRLLPRELVEQSMMGFRSIPNCLAHCQSDNVMYIQPTVLKINSWLN